ncbi:hypothetical protein DOT_3341, partial [Desulfosporosinus sp. OT]
LGGTAHGQSLFVVPRSFHDPPRNDKLRRFKTHLTLGAFYWQLLVFYGLKYTTY